MLDTVTVTFVLNRLEKINKFTMWIRGVIAADPTTMEGGVFMSGIGLPTGCSQKLPRRVCFLLIILSHDYFNLNS